MGLSASTHKRAFPTNGFCFLCESQDVPLTHHSSIQKRNACKACAEALAWADLTLRLVAFGVPQTWMRAKPGTRKRTEGKSSNAS